MNLKLYGIPNCDSVKKARTVLGQAGWVVHFHDFKKAGVPEERLRDWLQTLGWEGLLNRQGTTWKKLDPALQATVVDAGSAADLMKALPSVIKRPVIEWPDGRITVGLQPLQDKPLP